LPRVTVLSLLRRHWPIVLPALLTLAVFHAWAQPGLILGADWVRRVPAELNTFFPWPPAWNGAQQLGETNEVYLFEFPLMSLMGLLSRLDVSWSVIERVLFLWPYLILSVACPYALAIRLTRSPYASAVAASICTVNTWVIMATERGAIPSLIAAALIPLFMLMALNFIERPTPRRGLAIGLVLTVLLIYDLRYVYISVIMSLIFAVEQLFRDKSLERLRRAALSLGIAVFTAIVANLYWILPQFFEPANNGTDYGTLADYIYNSHFMTPQHALSDFAVFYHWVASNNPFYPAAPDWWFFLLPIGMFVSLFFVWRRKWVWSLATGAFIAVFLDSGPSFPVDKINIWIFLHVPGMSLFRDVTKWMSLLEVTYAVIIALGVTRLGALMRMRLGKRAMPAITASTAIVLVAAYALVMSDAFNVMRFRVFATYHVHDDVLALERFIQSRPNHDRTLVLPRDSEPMRAVLDHPFVEGLQIENSAPNDGFRHFNVHMGDLYSFFAAPYAPDLLRLMNIRYVVVPYDYDKVIFSPQIAATGYYDVVDFMKSRPWARFLTKIGRQYVFEVRDPLESRAFVAPLPFVLNGSAAGLAALAGTPLLNPRLGAILPDQNMRDIEKHVPNYVAAAWPVDTLANNKARASALIAQASDLDRAAQHGKFPYFAAAIDAASTSSTLFWDDQPTLMNSPFTWPRAGTASYRINTLNLHQLNKPVLRRKTFDTRLSTLHIGTRRMVFFLNTDLAVQQAGFLRYSTRGHFYYGDVAILNGNPVSLTGSFQLTGLSTSLGVPLSRVTILLGGHRFTCNNAACRVQTILPPGTNIGRLEIATVRRSGKASYGLHTDAIMYDARVVRSEATLPIRWLARNLNIRMTSEPTLRFDWRGPADIPPSQRYLVYVMRSVEDGSTMVVFDHVPLYSPDATTELSQWLELVLTNRFARLLADHDRDAAWLFANRLRLEPDGYGAYSLTAIGMTTVGGQGPTSREDLDRWLPDALELDATPEEYEIAGNDAGRPHGVVSPTQLSVVAPHYQESRNSSIFGIEQFTFARRDGNGRATIRINSRVNATKNADLDFDFYQDKAAFIELRVYDALGRLLFSQPMPAAQHRADFGAGSIVGENDLDTPWPIDTPHCEPVACASPAPSARGTWRHVSIDLSHLARVWRQTYALRFTLVPSGRHVGTIRFAVATRAAQAALKAGLVPALSLDGSPVRFDSTSRLRETEYETRLGSTQLTRGTHRVESYPTFPVRPVSIVFEHGKPRRFFEADIQHGSQQVGTEYSGTIDSRGGLLVFSEAYDSRWRLALAPKTFVATGCALIDYLRAKPYILPDRDHYRVDDTLNGWWIAGGRQNLFMIMSLDAILQLSALVWVVATAGWVMLILLRFRNRTA